MFGPKNRSILKITFDPTLPYFDLKIGLIVTTTKY